MKVFAKKIGTTHLYDERNKHIVATVLHIEKTSVAGVKTEERDGYKAIVTVLNNEKAKVRKSLKNQFATLNPVRITEERTDENVEPGTEYSVNNFAEGDLIVIKGTTKGKGFQGTVKRHGFNTGPKTHGSNNYRRPGSIGVTDPSRVVKGKKMAGHMGSENKTMKKVKVIRVDSENNHIWVKGHVLGPNKALITISK